jgi:tetratricopeptide (TPR) repeat protein
VYTYLLPLLLLAGEPLFTNGMLNLERIPFGTEHPAHTEDIRTGFSHAKRGELELAASAFSSVIGDDPNDARAFFYRGVVYAAMSKPDKAVADYTETIRLAPRLAIPYFFRGYVFERTGNSEKALADYDKAIDLDSDLAAAYVYRGRHLGRLRRYDEAIEDLNSALRLSPKSARPFFERGNVYRDIYGDLKGTSAAIGFVLEKSIKDEELIAETKRLEDKAKIAFARAIADYTEAIKIKQDDFSAVCRRGLCYHFHGDHDLAIADFSAAIRIDPNAAFVYILRGQAYAGSGNDVKAEQDFARALELGADAAEIEKAKAEVETLLRFERR